MKRSFFLFSSSFLVCIFLIGGCAQEKSAEPTPLDPFMQCLSDNGVKMYGSYTCSICAKQKKDIGPASRFLDEIECNPNAPGNQAEHCVEIDIQNTPTWILEKESQEVERIEGYMKLEALAKLSGCSLPQ